MLKLEGKLVLDEASHRAANLCDRFSPEDLQTLGQWVWEGYDHDESSRHDWKKRTSAAMDLALQMVRDKNFPWPNCSNVAFPIVTIAALQFHSRAYPALVDAPNIVKCRVEGADPTGELKQKADRISKHMSYQVLEQDSAWESQHDALLINLPIVGTAFKKSFLNPRLKHNVSELVLARDLVLNYWSKSVDEAERKTHIIRMSHNDIRERVLRKTFRGVLDEAWFKEVASQPQPGSTRADSNRRQGIQEPQPDDTTPFSTLEQHVSADLDQDGYAEPYIITIEESSKCVLRIVCRFARWPEDVEKTSGGKIISIRSAEYFTKYPFIPSPDGGIYDMGFGVLLGPLNENVNDIINKLNDAGTMQVTSGGFLGRGAKIRGGVYTFRPFEWVRVDSTGDDLKKSIVPLDTPEPSAVLFQLLVLLINYANRIPGTTEIVVGENPGQNTPAETSRNMLEQGLQIYSALFKRVWRSMKDEFKKLYILNGQFLPTSVSYGEGYSVGREDYLGSPYDICPAADPNITSDAMELQRIGNIKASAATTPGYDIEEVERRFLRAMRVDSPDTLYPGLEKFPPSPSEKLQIENMRLQEKTLRLQWDQQKFAAELMEEQRVNNAQIIRLEAEAAARLQDVQGDAEDRMVALINAELGLRKNQDESLRKRIDLIMKNVDLEIKGVERETAIAKGISERGRIQDRAKKSGNGSDSSVGRS